MHGIACRAHFNFPRRNETTLDRECFGSRAEAMERAKELARRGEVFAIEDVLFLLEINCWELHLV